MLGFLRKSPKRLETTLISPVEENQTAVLTAVDISQTEKLRKTGNVSNDYGSRSVLSKRHFL